jgi:hypothetical protein
VEDENVMAKELNLHFTRWGYQVVGAVPSGEQAVEIASAAQPDLILMDIVLQGEMDGIDAAAAIQAENHPALVYLTAYHECAYFDRARATDPFAYLVKPVSPHNLRRTAQVALHHRAVDQQLREREEHYRCICNEAPWAYHGLDETGVIMQVNDAWIHLMGYAHEEVVGRPFAHFVVPEERHRCGNKIARLKAEGQVRGLECIVVRRDGSRAIVSIDGRTVSDSRGRIVRIHCVMADITQRKAAEELARQAEAYRAVGDLAAGVAHNLNNVLQVIVGNAGVILMGLQSGDFSETEQNARQIIETSRFAAGMIKRLRRYARPAAGSRLAALERVDVSDVVRDGIRTAQDWWLTNPATAGRNITVETDLADDCGVYGARDDLAIAVVNLLKNAAEALKDGGRIRVTTTSGPTQVRLKVQDNGKGIPETDLTRVFVPLFTSKTQPGAGLGLAEARSIVESQGGSITASRCNPHGTVMTVTLPKAL